MRYRWYALLLPALIVLFLFYYDVFYSGYIEELYRIEKMYNDHPMEARAVLLKIDPRSLTRKERALYGLLRIKNHSRYDSFTELDSLAEEAIDYYRHAIDSSRLFQLYYFKGKILGEKGFLVRAAVHYRKAQEYAVENDLDTRYLLSSSMGRMYHVKMMREDEKRAKLEVLHYAGLLNDSLLLGQALIEMSGYYYGTGDYELCRGVLKQAVRLMPVSDKERLATVYAKLSQTYLSVNRGDSALYYIDRALALTTDRLAVYRYYNRKGDAFLKLGRKDSAEYYFSYSLVSGDIRTQMAAYYDLSGLKEESGDRSGALKYLRLYVAQRDSLDLERKELFFDNLSNIAAYQRAREKADLKESELNRKKITFYRILMGVFFVLSLLVWLSYRNERHRRKLKANIRQKEENIMRALLLQQEAENKLLKEREGKEQAEMERLSLTVEYYKRLNAMTIPFLLRSRNRQGAMHLKEEEWSIIIENTNACFEGFTLRIKAVYPQLTEEEIRFCCLIKMELPISLLSEVYHIARTSISRKKVRLKEKMRIEEMTLDDFIRGF